MSSFGNAIVLDERQLLSQFSPLPISNSMMSSPLLPSLSHSTPVNLLPRPQPILPGHLSPLNYNKLSPLASPADGHLHSSPESAFSPFSSVNKSGSSAANGSLSPFSLSYSPLSNASGISSPTGYLSRLRSNPMFQDLQMLLAQECHNLQVPASLITSQWNLDNLQTAMSPGTNASTESVRDYATSSSQQVYTLHMQLQDRFLRLHNDKDIQEAIRKMESLYCTEVGRVEMQRYQSLCTSYTDQKFSINIHYNKERITLVEKMQTQLDIITRSPTIKVPSTSTPIACRSATDSPSAISDSSLNELLSVPRPTEAHSYNSSASASNSSASVSNSSASNSLAFLSNRSVSNSSTSASNSSAFLYNSSASSEEASSSSLFSCNSHESTPESASAPKSRTGRLLSPVTLKLLSQWYEDHLTYPYPSDDDVNDLAEKGSLTTGQVRKWLANKRVRSFNTLSITGNDHPIKYKYRGKGGKGDSLEPIANRRPQYKLLSSAAKNILTDWYECHSENPYPTEEEKEDLAEKAGVSSVQVKSWFANKRSRTNNTKRQVPNYFIKKYPGYTPIVEMVSEQRAARKATGKAVERVRVDLYQPYNMA